MLIHSSPTLSLSLGGGPAKRISELRVVYPSRKITDIIWTLDDILIQDRVLALFRDEGFGGFEVKPAGVRLKVQIPGAPDEYEDEYDRRPGLPTAVAERIEVPVFWEFVVTGWGGMAPPESGMRPIPGSHKWEGKTNWGRLVDIEQWDGSDFFIVWPFPLCRIVTDRVVRCIKKHKLTGMRLIPLEKFSLHPLAGDGASPLRLSDHFPEPRAREIGEPLGIY